MNKAKKVVLGFFVVSLLVIGGIYAYTIRVEAANSGKITFFYGITCPHCKEVEAFMEEKNASAVLDIEMKEVYENIDNARVLRTRAKNCGIDVKNIGVPLIYSKGKCYVGKVEAIDFITKELAGIK